MCEYMCVCVCIELWYDSFMSLHLYIHIYTYIYIYIHIYTHINVHKYVYTCVSICVCVCVCVRVLSHDMTHSWFILYIYIYLYIHIHTHTHKYVYTRMHICACVCVCIESWYDSFSSQIIQILCIRDTTHSNNELQQPVARLVYANSIVVIFFFPSFFLSFFDVFSLWHDSSRYSFTSGMMYSSYEMPQPTSIPMKHTVTH